ncbi:MAG TPA: hypothetical protein VKR38_04830 [Usitatibacter sp.]|nr:hypothetical protein [Usitatibacter sp.]
MVVLSSSAALFLSGAVFGASIAHWYFGAVIDWGALSTSFLIAVIAAESLRRAFGRSRLV